MTERKGFYVAIMVRMLDYLQSEGKLIAFLEAARFGRDLFAKIKLPPTQSKVKVVAEQFSTMMQWDSSSPNLNVGKRILQWLHMSCDIAGQKEEPISVPFS